jgi:hypothetical protein
LVTKLAEKGAQIKAAYFLKRGPSVGSQRCGDGLVAFLEAMTGKAVSSGTKVRRKIWYIQLKVVERFIDLELLSSRGGCRLERSRNWQVLSTNEEARYDAS